MGVNDSYSNGMAIIGPSPYPYVWPPASPVGATLLYSVTHEGETQSLYQIEGEYGLLRTWSLEGTAWKLLRPKSLKRVLARLMKIAELSDSPDA